MRLTIELIANAEQLVGPNKERIICLRGYKIPAIENLGATNDHFDIIDLTENDLLRLDNFPPLKRLETLMVANNRVSRVAPEIFDYIPNLKSLLLTQNRISSLADLIPLFKAKKLERLSILDNPVTVKQHYRLFIIYNLPNLRFLDFQHVKEAERREAKEFFSGEVGSAMLKQLGTSDSTAAAVAESRQPNQMTDVEMKAEASTTVRIQPKATNGAASNTALTDEQVVQLQNAIAAASTLAEVQTLEDALKSGVFPPFLLQKKTDTANAADNDVPM